MERMSIGEDPKNRAEALLASVRSSYEEVFGYARPRAVFEVFQSIGEIVDNDLLRHLPGQDIGRLSYIVESLSYGLDEEQRALDWETEGTVSRKFLAERSLKNSRGLVEHIESGFIAQEGDRTQRDLDMNPPFLCAIASLSRNIKNCTTVEGLPTEEDREFLTALLKRKREYFLKEGIPAVLEEGEVRNVSRMEATFSEIAGLLWERDDHGARETDFREYYKRWFLQGKRVLAGGLRREFMECPILEGVIDSFPQESRNQIDRAKHIMSTMAEEITRSQGGERLQCICEALGIEYPEIVRTWIFSSGMPGALRDLKGALGQKSVSMFTDFVRRELVAVQKLEKDCPGSVSTLHSEFGITLFSRYPVEALKEQYEKRNDEMMPYGVSIAAISDWNGSFLNDREPYQKMCAQLKERGWGIRFMEVNSLSQAYRGVRRMDRRYRRKSESGKPLSFVIVSGHGSQEGGVSYGGKSKLSRSVLAQTWDRIEEKVNTMFSKHPVFIFNSCSVGAVGSVAELFVRIKGGQIIASKRNTSLRSISVEISGEDPIFSVEYEKSNGKDPSRSIRNTSE